MQLYTGISGQFVDKALRNELAVELAENFARYLGSRPFAFLMECCANRYVTP
ncbi:hypothetical protein emb_1c0462 [Coriobacteriaceae bacterium EMTCatB1]|nr:hypothetical protein [Anaerosomatales bacterium]GAV31788.1 hypothetical protein emb_1c0462 [Coriobacteriaceae bacterium EMTCatB1]